MIEPSNKTIESCEFTADKVNVFVGYAEDNLSFEVVLSEVGGWQARCDEECLAGRDKDEVLQQKEIENSLSSDEGNANEDEAVMHGLERGVDLSAWSRKDSWTDI